MKTSAATFVALAETIEARKGSDPKASYVASLFAKGRAKIAQKVGEEAVETAMAVAAGDDKALVSESADLMFHLMVLLSAHGLSLDDIAAELARREGLSGLVEKANRAP